MNSNKFYKKTKAYGRETSIDSNALNHFLTISKLMGNSGRVLELGCGDGLAAEYFQKTTKNKIVGIDINPQSIRICKKRGIEARVGNVEKTLPFKNNEFDGVLANEIIEHLFDHHYFLDEIYRVLKPNGYIVIATNNLGYWVNRLLVLLGKAPLDFQPHKDLEENQHIRLFTPKSMKELLRKHGFKVEKCFTRYPQIPFLVRFSRKFGNPYINAGNFGYSLYARGQKMP